MRIKLSLVDYFWWGAFYDRDRDCLYIAPIPHLMILIAWGPQFDHGHMKATGLVARRDRITGVVETLLRDRDDAWQKACPVNYGNFRPGSPAPPIGDQK